MGLETPQKAVLTRPPPKEPTLKPALSDFEKKMVAQKDRSLHRASWVVVSCVCLFFVCQVFLIVGWFIQCFQATYQSLYREQIIYDWSQPFYTDIQVVEDDQCLDSYVPVFVNTWGGTERGCFEKDNLKNK